MEPSNKAVAIAVVPVEDGKDYDLLVLTERGEIWINRDFQNWSLVIRGDFPTDDTFMGSSSDRHYITK
jgi:hypothetical protein